MWSKQQTATETPASSPLPMPTPNVTSINLPSPARPISTPSRSAARIGSSLQIKGHLTGSEDLQIDGVVNGPISLSGHELTVGPTAQLTSEIHAGDVVVLGKVVGNVHARGRVDIRTNGSITGDIACARISIEDGAHFKGRIEIDPARSQAAAD
ncbi:MAG TPA: polymer-forming cytoskeletal protein [Candidatus Methylomirabilis sp.]|nr:polymer-forming cytoskeletal protein [Candidatus Methylomirabilis sp.]